MKRILVLGNAGSGKSTLAIQLSAILDLPVVHLVSHFWQPGWQESPRDQWQRRVAALITADTWVMDGNYLTTLPERLAAADTVILLDLPRIQCIVRVLLRSLRDRGKQRADLAQGCVEQLPDWTFLRWIWRFPQDDMRPMLTQLTASANTKRVTVLRSTRAVRQFLRKLGYRSP